MQGIGGSGLYSLTFIIFPEISTPEMSQVIGAAAGAVAMAGILGPVLGGVITHYTTWRWIFWINGPIGIIPLIVFIIAWPKPHQIIHAPRRSWKQLDLIGAVLVIAASVCVVFAFQQGGIMPDSWNKPIFIVPLVIGCLCYVLLFCWEVAVAKYWAGSFATMFPLHLIKHRVYMGYVLVTLIGGFPYFMFIYTLPLRLQVVNENSQLVAGLALLPMVGAVAVFSSAAAIINTKKNLIFETLLTGALFSVLWTALLSTLKNVPWIEGKMYGFQVFIGIGFGLMVSTTSLGGGLERELKDTTVAQGIIAQVRVLGGSIGIAATTAIMGTTLRRDLAKYPHLAGTEGQAERVEVVNADAFRQSMQVCAAITGVGVLATFLVWRKERIGYTERRRQQMENAQKLRRQEGEVEKVGKV
ncbi:hypothetical protein HYALB_00009558 [Hymenoscyphus albidus]|uniref:Major facilitator superfamily (MFS) profile domain-containing protein n=1 Tax=Hymenoscyphus albidus TaxID=595503 RepID=A0A9N9Q446_9HELO|nr:hypothetical protein HYALB_00009558 [Hymenoscyphus albidus]